MLRNDGDFLVRESSNSTGQFVLSSRQDGHIKHLLLVDPEGVVSSRGRGPVYLTCVCVHVVTACV